MITGGCFCGEIRYEAGRAFDETNCHCSICRRTTAAPFVAWFTVKRAEFRMTHGTPTRFNSTATAVRSFCSLCGTQITFENAAAPDEIDVTTCSLDAPELVPPVDHTFVSSRLEWVRLADELPKYNGKRID